MNIFWNLYNYYKQFLPKIEAKIKEIRAPIEKKLRDYVKIVTWKDISYWSIRETLQKTHKTIHKYMREYEVRNVYFFPQLFLSPKYFISESFTTIRHTFIE